jgi:outer membrane protein OmpA-like peptidoglycan-associated protein
LRFASPKGILPERVLAVGYGESRPADTHQTSDGRSQIRPVEVVITAQLP